MRIRAASIVLLVCASMASQARAQEKATVRLNLAPGTSWTFGQSEVMDIDTTVSAGGQQQQMKQKGSRKISGKAEVLESSGGIPTALRFTFDQDCGGMMDQGMGQQMPLPFSLAGQTVTVRLANGQMTHDFKGQIDPQTLSDLDGLAQQEQRYLPQQPVGVGDRWSPDAAELAKSWQLDPSRNKIGVVMEVKEFMDVKGRRAMVVLMTADVTGEVAPGLSGSRKLQGPVLIDVDTGRILSADLNGMIEMSGAQQNEGMQMSMQSRGNVSIKIESSIPQGGAPAPIAGPMGGGGIAGGNPPPAGGGGNPLGGGGNPLGGGGGAAPAPASLAGTYQDDQIKFELRDHPAGYSGTITMGDQRFPANATMQGGALVGTFESGNERFDFTARVTGDAMEFVTGNTTYNLKRKKNPLAR